MPLSRELRKDLTTQFQYLKRQVTLQVFTQEIESASCREIRALAEEFAEITAKISVEENDFLGNGNLVRKYGIDKIPALAVVSKEGLFVRFYGAPSGYTMPALIEAIKEASSGLVTLNDKTLAYVEGLKKDLHLEVLSLPTEPHCLSTIILIQKLAFASRRVFADMVDIQAFPQLAIKHSASALPLTVVNGSSKIEGSLSEEGLVEKLAKALE